MKGTQILNHNEIELKLDRISWQILEEHVNVKGIFLAGIDDRGKFLAEELASRLRKNDKKKSIEVVKVVLDKDAPFESLARIQGDVNIKKGAIVLVDDVLNSGATMAAAVRALLDLAPQSLKVAVLADRSHKRFPIKADYVGMSLATTLQEHITFVNDKGNLSVWVN